MPVSMLKINPRLDLKIMELRLELDAAEKLPVVKGHEEESEKFKGFPV